MEQPKCHSVHAAVLCGSDELGTATSKALSRAGVHVFTIVRTFEQALELRTSSKDSDVRVMSDIDSQEGLRDLVGEIQSHVGDAGLDVLITETVTRRPYPLEFAQLDLLREHWRTHVEGPVLAVQAFMPLLRQARGRVLINGTIGGRLTLPFSGVLSSSGHAIRALADALRQELAPWRVDVVLIEIAGVRNDDGFAGFANQAMERGPDPMRQLYGRMYTTITQRALTQEKFSWSPESAAAALKDAALVRQPRRRYLVGRRARALATLSSLPTSVQDRIKRRMLPA